MKEIKEAIVLEKDVVIGIIIIFLFIGFCVGVSVGASVAQFHQ